METIRISFKYALLIAAALFVSSAPAQAFGNRFDWENLQSDIAGVAEFTDTNLVNSWGMALSPSGTIFVNDNGTGVATLYNQDGTPAPNRSHPLVITIPP